MKKHKKDPLYKSFGYAFQGIYTCISKERNMKIHCCVSLLVVIAGIIFQFVSDRMVYLSDIVWTCDGIGAGEHIDRGSGGSCNRGAKAFGEDCQGYGGRSLYSLQLLWQRLSAVLFFVPKVMQFLTGL